MGVIERSFRKRSNQKLAAEVYTQTALSFDEVTAVVLSFCNSKNNEVTERVEASQANAKNRISKWIANQHDPKYWHYYVSPHPEMRQILIGFGQQPEPILAGGGYTSWGVWAAALSYPSDGNVVGLKLLKWVINNDGVMRHRSNYETLLESLHSAISAQTTAEPALVATPRAGQADDSTDAPTEITDDGSDEGTAADPGRAEAPAATSQRQLARAAFLVKPLHTSAGAWIQNLGAEFPFLTRNEIVGLAGMRALLAVDTGHYCSSYLSEGLYGAAQMYGSLLHSLVRCNVIQHSGKTVLTCGAPKPDLTFIADWQMTYSVSADGEAVLEVPHYRRSGQDGKDLRSAELFVQLRDALTEYLAAGVRLRLGDGPPETADLVDRVQAGAPGYPDNDDSPLGHDYLGGVTDVYSDPFEVPLTAREAVLTAMSQSHFRTRPGDEDELCVASLAGGRPYDSGSVALRRAGENDQLLIRLPGDLGPVEQERSYRAALRFLDKLARSVKETQPELSAAINGHVRRIGSDVQRSWAAASGMDFRTRPPGLWVRHWSTTSAAPMVRLATDRWYPIGVLVVSPSEVNYVLRAIEAADWVTVFKRTKPIIGPNGKPTNRHTFTARRCGLLRNASNQALPYLRFASNDVIWDYSTPSVVGSQAWFWEVNARPATTTSGSGGLMFTTGWSHADGVLGYGENLMSLLRAFVDVVSRADENARVQTLYLAT